MPEAGFYLEDFMITEVAYGFTFNLGDYQSERIDCRVRVEPDETPEHAIERARLFVQQQHDRTNTARTLSEEIEAMQSALKYREHKIQKISALHKEAVTRYNEVREALASQGVNIPAIPYWDLPQDDQAETPF